MDSVVHAALEEICAQGTNGLSLHDLWPKLHYSLSSHGLSLCPAVKRALWANILDVPGLQFDSQGVKFDSSSDLEICEQRDVKIIAPEQLRNCFIGIYDIKTSDITQVQRRTLERLAIARSNGIAQSELAKEFGIKGNNIFYILKKLETRGLIVRQSTVIRTKESSNDGEPKNSSIISTNMLHLHRYAKHLGCQQRLEITKEDKRAGSAGLTEEGAATDNQFAGEFGKEDIMVKDYLPALKAICDKLENATGHVLVVSDIKRDLGYRGTSGHRAWRHICHRLKDARVVEEFCAKVNNKEVNCLRLVRNFSPQHFEASARAHGSDDLDTEPSMQKLGKRGQITEQLVELPIEQQIYDMIDAEGSKGLTITDVCKRLGIPNKQYYNRLLNMFARFGMHLQAEGYNRGVAYRVWTSGNFNPEASNIVPSPLMAVQKNTDCTPNMLSTESSVELIERKNASTSQDNEKVTGSNESVVLSRPQTILHGIPEQNSQVLDLEHNENLGHNIQEVGALICMDNSGSFSGNETRAIASDGFGDSTADTESNTILQHPNNSENSACKTDGAPNVDLQIVSTTASNSAVLDTPPTITKPRRRRSYQKYPCLALGAASALREQRILKMLQEEKFLIKPELHRRLESFDKDKNTMMDRKTLERSLNKLQQEGHCKCIHVSVPVITNCGRSRTTEVVLHPSAYDVSPEFMGQIHERMRSFDMQVRRQSYSRPNKGTAVLELNNIERIPNNVKPDELAAMAEVRRTNGFVLAKMVRTKLLHIFLWGYITGSPGWDDALSFGRDGYELHNPYSTCKSFEPDAAIKAMPIELFLQIAGSTQRFEDMIEKCRSGLRLSDLPVDEYKSLMDTRATGRLSWLIDILRRLKLIRLVSGGAEDVSKTPHTTLTHALELKPYMEEPVSVVASSLGFFSADLRPQIRHDFVLSNKKAVDEYWNTLEYCYSAADPKAALHAFPGSAVHEVFRSKSWASVRLMTADQRAELLKRVGNEEPDKKLTFRECEKIAKDLSLTLEQVLRVYYDKRQQRLSRFSGRKQGMQRLESIHVSSSRKRKKPSDRKSTKHVNEDISDSQTFTDNQFDEEQYIDLLPGDNEYNLHYGHIDELVEADEEAESNEDEDNHGFIHKCALSKLKPKRRRKFSWTEKADRQLVIEYVRHRAALGANFHRADWCSLPNLPAPPDTCRRRMALLNSSSPFRKALMRLCNLLTDRYAKYLEQFQKISVNTIDCRMMVRDLALVEDCHHNSSDGFEDSQPGGNWDNFDEPDVKTALNDVLRLKKAAKPEVSQSVQDTEDTGLRSLPPPSQEAEDRGSMQVSQRSRSNCLPPRYIKLLSEGIGVNRRAFESVAVSNAIELFKLIFLSTSTAPEVPTLLAETLRRYSEHDLFAAFNYLREKKIMIGGSGTSPFVLSQHFLQSVSLSPFPVNTGKRAAKFASWLHEKKKDLMEGVELPADLQCGDVMHLCAILSLGELSITPLLPDEGIGEAEDTRASKRRHDDSELYCSEKSKRLRSSFAGEGEIISRREKGFPGIKLCLNCTTIPRKDALQLFKDNYIGAAHLSELNEVETISGLDVCNISHHSDGSNDTREVRDFGCTIQLTSSTVESPWEAMTNYAQHLFLSSLSQEGAFLFNPELFRNTCTAIQKAGDQGLSIKELSKIMNTQGVCSLEIFIEVLEAFGRALKVNTYDSVHMVDALYRSKYFLTSVASLHQDCKSATLREFKEKMDDKLISPNTGNLGAGSRKEPSENANEVHRVTILNLPDEVAESSQGPSIDRNDGYTDANCTSEKENLEGEVLELNPGDSVSSMPILPWINGDGTINELVYKGLVRRVLGIIMQNPGTLEEVITNQLPVLNPQSCNKLLEVMILDNHITVRKMPQKTSAEPPSMLCSLIGSRLRKSTTLVCRDHLFANPSSSMLL